ncbi:hypothetical protein DM02DRAFT_659660 [Periconia macrospinosa]|uniref:Ecp2 effector protein domain-containing protein n=1 Tax=Periconia macrospinosa TaxID=97972 RepID=A0A2V1DD56_9PLEO|nr:hypothetical protein DM02DRAFT_659660 [Periconia macrospinosa]
MYIRKPILTGILILTTLSTATSADPQTSLVGYTTFPNSTSISNINATNPGFPSTVDCGEVHATKSIAGILSKVKAPLKASNRCTYLNNTIAVVEVVKGCMCGFYANDRCQELSGQYTGVVGALGGNDEQQRSVEKGYSSDMQLAYYQCMRFDSA